ncbi:hypothetical protein KFK09_007109 [Dendrobium nobile]|uniref:RRM domain-containing protein n=1 Tax=Dendrobium nobile TaxID=94219 RepID=A0A8T3BR13_DENNO|nr:hypothetical protein KFK09_007109 [Dendrobium nobile]
MSNQGAGNVAGGEEIFVHEVGVFYAFIEFEDVVGIQNALMASSVLLNGRIIHVEGRRPNSGASRGRSKFLTFIEFIPFFLSSEMAFPLSVITPWPCSLVLVFKI